MKKTFRRGLAMFMCAIMIACVVPFNLFGTEASAVNTTYCATAAAQWAKDHVYDYDSILFGTGYYNNGGDCANFVSQCLYMGGIDMTGYWNHSGYLAHFSSSSSDYEGSFIRCKQLANYLQYLGAKKIQNPSASQVEIGDVILFYKPELGRFGHSCIVIDKVNGVPVVAAHSVSGSKDCYRSDDAGYNNNWHLGFDGEYTYLFKMNGTKCYNDNPRSFDVYTASGYPYLYSSTSTSSSVLSQYISGEYTHIYQTKDGWGYTFRYGKWGWVRLSSFNYRRHVNSASVDHIWGSWKTVTVANCKQDGLAERYCQRCGLRQTKTTKGGHITDPKATCLTQGYCKICGEVTEEALGHDWDKGTITTQPTCTETGIKTYVCKRDSSHTYTEVVPALGHNYVAGATAPTCTTDGTKIYKCSRCSDSYVKYISSSNTWSDWMDDATLASILPSSKVDTRTLYRYKTRSTETTTSYNSSLSGYTQNGYTWETQGTQSFEYSTEFPSGFDTGNSIYTSMAKSDSLPSASTGYQYINKTTAWAGYVYWHWMYDAGGANGTQYRPINNVYGYGHDNNYLYKYFDAFKSTNGSYSYDNYYCNSQNITNYITDKTAYSECHGASRFFRFNYYKCTYTVQRKLYKYYKYNWSDWTSWSTTKQTASDTKKVETKTQYRYDLIARGHDFSVDSGKTYINQNKLLQTEAEWTGTCYSTGTTCSRCGVVNPDSPTTAHKFTKWAKLSSTEQISYCDNGCGCYRIKSTTCTHNWVKQSTVAPHCTTDGYTTYKCSLCGQTRTDDVTTKLGHENSEEWVRTKEPTCTEYGTEVAKCVRWDDGETCEQTYTRTVEPTGHQMTEFEATAMTCTKDGNTEYYYCSACEKYFSDEAGTNEIKEGSWVIEATGHKAGDWIVEDPNGCGHTGRECRYCVNEWCDEREGCPDNQDHGIHGYLMDEREIDMIDPDYYVFKTENAAGGPGISDYVATTCCNNSYIYITCRNCEGTDHAHGLGGDVDYSKELLDPLSHTMEVTEEVKPSCVHPGYRKYECTSCTTDECDYCLGASYIEVLPAERSEHKYLLAETVDSECSAGTPLELYVCQYCGMTECDDCTENGTPHYYWTGDPLNHDMEVTVTKEPTCTEPGTEHHKCKNCDYCYDVAIDPLGHDMSLTKTIEPSCLEEGFEIWTCSRCGFTEKRNTKDALGHLTTSPYVVTTKATCITDGLEEQFCTRVSNGVTCGAKLDEEIIPQRNHNMGEWYEDPASTTENQLCRKRDCLNTDSTDKYEACTYTETEGHLWGPWVYDGEDAKTHTKTCQYKDKEKVVECCTFTSEVTRKATCTEDGVRTYTCAVCGGQYTEVIPARKHNWTDWYVTKSADLTTKGEERRDCTNTVATSEYEACDCFETRETEVTGANYKVVINQMDTTGKYVVISDKSYCDLIGKFVEADFTVDTGFTCNYGKSNTTGVITRDGSLVLNVYIDRNIHQIAFDDGTNFTPENKYFDDTITAPADPEKEGYTFNGWSEDGKTVVDVERKVPDRDITYIAVWEINEYTITWNYDGGGREVETYKYNDKVKIFTPPEKEGHTFTGWDGIIPNNMPAENLEFNAEYLINRYTITYILADEEYAVNEYEYNTEITPVVPDKKTGYDFSGWTPSEPVAMPAENLTLYGSWIPSKGTEYKVNTYLMDVEGNYNLYKTETFHATTDETVNAVDTTTEGFHINKDKSTLSGQVKPDGSLVLEIYLDRNIHNISFDNGTNKTDNDLYFGEDITIPEDPVKEGYTFKGWSEDGETPETVLPTVPDRDVAYKAVWEINQYTITFDTDGGTEVDPISQDFDTGITKPADPEKTGYTFAGWDTEIPAKMPAEDMTITAIWIVNQYTITFDTDGGSEIDPITQDYNSDITRPEDPTKEGYTFVGWDTEIPGKMPAEDIEIKAIWEINQYTITFITNGGTPVDPITQDYNTDIIAPVNPTREGYTFAGWDTEIPAKMPAKDMTISAQWDINQYKITFDTDGGSEIDPITQDYGTDITPPEDPTKEGYTFVGWDTEIPGKMPAEDVEIKAIWEINQYTITYTYGRVNDGKVYDSATQDYNTEIIAPEDPSFTGYTFVGWSEDVPGVMPAQDKTLDAQWVNNIYTVTWWVEGERTVEDVTFGDEITIPADPSVDGKIFKGWSPEIPETMPAENLEFYAGFENITHKAIFVIPDKNGSITIGEDTFTEYYEETFNECDKVLSYIPEVPNEDSRYNAYWDNDYTLGKEDIYIKANYDLKKSEDESDLITDKKVVYENGTAKITLTAFAETLNAKVKYGAEPVDVIMVLDTSSSMNSNRMSNGETRLEVLKDTANDFIDNIYSAAADTDADHRVAIVSFNTNASRLTGTSDTDAFVDVRSGKDSLTGTINNLSYNQGTRSDSGLEVAKAILAANNNDGRRKIVIFLTDGVPTTSGSFTTSYANNAIGVANDIKNIYNTPIYAIGVSIDADPDAELVSDAKTEADLMNKFMHYVSSNYAEATQLTAGGSSKAEGYFITADDSNTLKSIFDNITAQQISNTITFSNVTFHDTVSEYFTLTVEQETALRDYLKAEYGVPAENIIITRSESGTDIVIKDVSPKPVYENNVQTGYGITITFEVSANEKAVDAGFYSVTTDDNASLEKDGVVIAEFNMPDDIQISESRTIVKYMIDGEIYAIRETDDSGTVTPVESSYAVWESGNNSVASDDVIEVEGEYTTATRTITWIAGDNELRKEYHIGEIIVVPDITAPSGYDFTGWDAEIPFRMGSSDLTFTAQFSEHTHEYELTSVSGLCTEGIEKVYTCVTCGETKTEKSDPCSHSFAAKVSMADDLSYASVICTNCGYKYQEDTLIDYKASTSVNAKEKNLIDLTLREDDIAVQPDGTITVTVALDGSLANARALYVYRVNEDGSKELVQSQKVGQTVVLTLDHFSYYVFSTDVGSTDGTEIGDIECVYNGHKYVQKSDITNHWDECTVCGDKINVEPHADSENVVTCDVCGRDLRDATAISVELDKIDFFFKDTAEIGATSTWGKLIYTSSDENVAKVDENGKVTATGRGKCTITVTVEGTDISKTVEVKTNYKWWQWIHWFLFGWIWYFKHFSFADAIESVPQFLQSFSQAILEFVKGHVSL